jgi:hypothetical protein
MATSILWWRSSRNFSSSVNSNVRQTIHFLTSSLNQRICSIQKVGKFDEHSTGLDYCKWIFSKFDSPRSRDSMQWDCNRVGRSPGASWRTREHRGQSSGLDLQHLKNSRCLLKNWYALYKNWKQICHFVCHNLSICYQDHQNFLWNNYKKRSWKIIT